MDIFISVKCFQHKMGFRSILILVGLVAVASALEKNSVLQTRYDDQDDNGNAQDVTKKFGQIETSKLENLLARIDHLEARDKSREKMFLNEIKSLKRQLLIQGRPTASLEGIVGRLSNKNHDSLNQDIESGDSKETTNDINKRIKPASKQSQEEVQSQRIRRAENENTVAFFATLSHHLTHVGAHQPITFNNVVTNIGNAYNSHFGSFVAPVSGTYVFSATLFSHYHTNYHAQFVKNRQVITTMYVSGSEAGYDTTSQTIILELQKGDDVCVQNYDTDKPVYGNNYSTFAGFLLQEDMESPAIVGK